MPNFKDNQPIPLDDHLCFSLYATSRAIQKLYHGGLSECKLTYPQYLVLVALYEHQELTVKKLGALLSLDSGTLTPLLKRLENEGLLTRNRSKSDERVVNVHLTDAGVAKREEANNLPEILVEKSGLSEAEWNQLENLSNKLYENISK
ncbi:MarR family transcriptional regulator [Companilactobacillus alimentarius]|uniref:HTH-type transcriptional regulator SarZ n=1 Tax=Companilactobacillus alimentarius DSM 20249 TaxID=1423720 RepID=A0A2K9HI28_9LACO|nr:MarR family transcriptional regulator [Companilactobacillus alimentarius]AUI72211.1 MarR family transcriptional regulator [Companilactobacillus alimentarius DSM 20249]KRK77078.1 MarR family transcriptional regulator [Companilactobacillus alimentarius DSM 20249]MDT6952780.1 MarR family transcriptional regulator [Companilactobacillus alimentarius]GEO45993.1 MarR family transcriptional regulator [Companilactobacillus alimentarius]